MADLESTAGSVFSFIVLVYKIILIYVEVCVNFFASPTKKSIKGQNVLITGAGHGLGREIAIKFAQEGTNLVLVDINEASNNSVKQELNKNYLKESQKVLAYAVDIRDETKVADLASKVKRDLGTIDILVNNAGIVQCLPFSELSPSLVERTFQVNVFSHIWLIRHFLPDMIKNDRGHIVAIASIAGIIGSKYLTDYCASKYAVVGLMDSLTKELHDRGANQNIHLTTVCPASMSTGMFHNFTTKFSWLLPVLTANQVAAQTVNAVLLNKPFVAVPQTIMFFCRLATIIPTKVGYLIQDYLDYGVKPHDNPTVNLAPVCRRLEKNRLFHNFPSCLVLETKFKDTRRNI